MTTVLRGSDNFDTAGSNLVKAWVNFNGTGTVAILASFNVSSITDNGASDYTVNFTAALTDSNYVPLVSGSMGMNSSSSICGIYSATQFGAPALKTTTQCRIFAGTDYLNTAHDLGGVYASFFR